MHLHHLSLWLCRFVAGSNAGDAADQLKQLIRELHRAGLEVLLEVSSLQAQEEHETHVAPLECITEARGSCCSLISPPYTTAVVFDVPWESTHAQLDLDSTSQRSTPAVCLQAEFCLTSESGGGIGGRLQSYAGLDGDMYLRGGGGPEATGKNQQSAMHNFAAASLMLIQCSVLHLSHPQHTDFWCAGAQP